MPVAVQVKRSLLLAEGVRDPYDVGDIPSATGENVNPSEAASIAALARELRAEVLGGAYAEGDKLPSRVELAARMNLSAESGSVVLRTLRDEGLVTLEQGRGTFVCKLTDFEVTVTAGMLAGTPNPMRGSKASLRRAERSHPAVSRLSLQDGNDGPAWTMIVRAADPARAAGIALAVARMAAGGAWDSSRAALTARPVS